MKLRKLLTAVLALTMALSMVACGSKKEEEKAEASPTPVPMEEVEKEEVKEEVKEEAPAEATDLTTLEVGQKGVKYGTFNWQVLDVQDGKALLITEQIVDYIPYNKACEATNWKDCTLRAYLNDKFIKDNFSEEEQAKMVETTITNPDNEWFGTKGCEDTQDRVYLLSIAEAVHYFGDSGQFENGNPDSPYFIDDEYNENRIATAIDSAEEWNWWFLRSPGGEDGRAADMSDAGLIIVYGDCTNAGHGTRPVVWVDMAA